MLGVRNSRLSACTDPRIRGSVIRDQFSHRNKTGPRLNRVPVCDFLDPTPDPDPWSLTADSWSCRAGRRHGQNGIDRLGILSSPQLMRNRLIPQEAWNPGECREMIGTGAFGRQQQKNKVDRLIVERVKIDRPLEARKQSEQSRQIRHFPVRNGNAVADRGGAELFPLHQDVEYRSFALPAQQGGARGQLLQHLLLIIDLERRKNRVWRDQIGERHGWNLKDELLASAKF